MTATVLHFPVERRAECTDRDAVIAAIKALLQKRSGKAWSVTGGRGTAWGWITITAPPRRRDGVLMTVSDAAELHELLGMSYDPSPDADGRVASISVPASAAFRREYLDRAAGRTPRALANPYWD